MLNNNFRQLANLSRVNTRLITNPSAMNLLRSVRLFPKRAFMEKNSLLRFAPKRNFNK